MVDSGKYRTTTHKGIHDPIHYLCSSISLEDGLSFETLLCPACGNNYNHIGSTYTLDGNDNYESATGYRGDALITNMRCENGHNWELVIAFHKGHSEIFVRYQLPNLNQSIKAVKEAVRELCIHPGYIEISENHRELTKALKTINTHIGSIDN